MFSPASGSERTALIRSLISVLQITVSGEPSNCMYIRILELTDIMHLMNSFELHNRKCETPEGGQLSFCHKDALRKLSFCFVFPYKVGTLGKMNPEGIKITQEEMSRKSK